MGYILGEYVLLVVFRMNRNATVPVVEQMWNYRYSCVSNSSNWLVVE